MVLRVGCRRGEADLAREAGIRNLQVAADLSFLVEVERGVEVAHRPVVVELVMVVVSHFQERVGNEWVVLLLVLHLWRNSDQSLNPVSRMLLYLMRS